MNIELSSFNVLVGMSILCLMVLLFIAIMRIVYRAKSIKPLRNIGYNFKLGVLTALTFVLLSFSWTTYEQVEYELLEDILTEVLPIDVPPTPKPPPPPPPPPPPVIEDVPEEMMPDDDDMEFLDQSVEEESVVIDAPIEESEEAFIPPPPPPPVVEVDIPEIVDFAEQMPRFPGCEMIDGNQEEKKACANKKLLEYIYDHLRYPRIALETGIEGTVVLQFIIDKEGKVINTKVIREIGGGCEAAAVKVVNDMNKLPERWTPGRQRGRKVSVKYTLPIKFKQLK